ncbi:MAG: hypothetical protein IKD70_05550, partial [Eggerthellaceae bacterium]|nr:hypothetical protein [Eggerthellaceae bacterium]
SGNSEKTARLEFLERYAAGVPPRRPALRWFRNDEEIKNLIDARCSGDQANLLTEYNFDVSSSSSFALSMSYARKIDTRLEQLKLSSEFSLAATLNTETRKRLTYTIVF